MNKVVDTVKQVTYDEYVSKTKKFEELERIFWRI